MEEIIKGCVVATDKGDKGPVFNAMRELMHHAITDLDDKGLRLAFEVVAAARKYIDYYYDDKVLEE